MRINQIPELRETERHAPGRSLAGDSVTYEGEASLIFKIVEGRYAGRGAAMAGNTICYFDIPEKGEIFHESELGEIERTGLADWKCHSMVIIAPVLGFQYFKIRMEIYF